MLQMIMKMRLGGITGVAALSQNFTAPDLIAGFHFYRALLEMRQHRHFILPMLNHHTVAHAGVRIHRARNIITHAFDDIGHSSIGWRKDIPAEGVIILILFSLAVVGFSLRADSEQVEGKPLVRHIMMMVQLAGVAAPKDQPSIPKGQR